MDAQMTSTQFQANVYPDWDLDVDEKNQIVPIIEGERETGQAAAIAAYLNVGSINQLPQAGVPWTDYLVNNAGFNDIDAAIKNNLSALGITTYVPDYDIINDKLVVQVVKI